MKVEVVGYYPTVSKKKVKSPIIGTLHVYLVDEEIDLRGIHVIENKRGKYFVRLPHQKNYDKDEKKMVEYPIFNFFNAEKNAAFKKVLIDACQQYLKKELKQ